MKGDVSPEYQELLQLEEQAKQQGLGKWSKVDAKTLFFDATINSSLLNLQRRGCDVVDLYISTEAHTWIAMKVGSIQCVYAIFTGLCPVSRIVLDLKVNFLNLFESW